MAMRNAMDIYNYRNIWDYLINDRLLSILRNLLGANIYYLHDMSIVTSNLTKPNIYSWHRDNPCKITGKGPDWDKNELYNVVSTITYFTPNKDTGSGISVIPFSHKNAYAYTLSNILRVNFYSRSKFFF
jgi:hypothetical protein